MRCVACKTRKASFREAVNPKLVYCSQNCQTRHHNAKIGLIVDKEDEAGPAISDPDLVGLISSDGVKFRIKRDLIFEGDNTTSQLIKDLINYSGVNDYLVIPYVKGEALQTYLGTLYVPLEKQFFDMFLVAHYLNDQKLLGRLILHLGINLWRVQFHDEKTPSFLTIKVLFVLSDYLIAGIFFMTTDFLRTQLFIKIFDFCAKNGYARREALPPNMREFHDTYIQITHAFRPWTLATAAKEGLIVTVRFLLDAPADLNFRANENDNEPIITAAGSGHAEVVNLLLDLPLERGVLPDAQQNKAFISAAEAGHVHVAETLLAAPRNRGVDPAAQRNKAFVLAAQNGHVGMVTYLLGLEQVNPADQENRAFRRAVAFNQVEVVELLLQHRNRGIDPTAKRNRAFQRAARHGYVKMLEILLREPDVNPGDENNKAFMLAAKNGRTDVIRLLLDKIDRGVNPEDNECIALPLAAAGRHLDVVALLLERRRDYLTVDALNVALEEVCGNDDDEAVEWDKETEIVRLLLKDGRIEVARIPRECMDRNGTVGEMLRAYANAKRQKLGLRLLK